MKKLIIMLFFIFTFGCAHFSICEYSWPPPKEIVEQICVEENVDYNKIKFIFRHVDKGMAVTTYPYLVIIEPGKDWEEVLRHELKHIRLFMETGDGHFHLQFPY